MMVDTERSHSPESQPWDDKDEYWAQECDGKFETNLDDDEEHKGPTKRA